MICANRPYPAMASGGTIAAQVPAVAVLSLRMVRLGVLSASLCGAAMATPDRGALFAEPKTGRPVSGYTVDLAVDEGHRQSFDVPRECPELNRLSEARRADTTRVVDRRLWEKVTEDCWFHAFLNRHPFRGIKDFVSDYDFHNARLDDLPIDQDCANTATDGRISACAPAATDRHGLLQHFPLSEPVGEAHQQAAPGDCLLRDGVFFGRLFIGPDGIHCDSLDGRPSLRLIAVDYADINGDGYLDAVLRFAPIGPGAARSPLILPVTRHGPKETFDFADPDRRSAR